MASAIHLLTSALEQVPARRCYRRCTAAAHAAAHAGALGQMPACLRRIKFVETALAAPAIADLLLRAISAVAAVTGTTTAAARAAEEEAVATGVVAPSAAHATPSAAAGAGGTISGGMTHGGAEEMVGALGGRRAGGPGRATQRAWELTGEAADMSALQGLEQAAAWLAVLECRWACLSLPAPARGPAPPPL